MANEQHTQSISWTTEVCIEQLSDGPGGIHGTVRSWVVVEGSQMGLTPLPSLYMILTCGAYDAQDGNNTDSKCMQTHLPIYLY